MFDLVVRNGARDVVVLVPSISFEQALVMVAGWAEAGAIAEAASVELCRAVPRRFEAVAA